jgi:Zn-dependent peptidase ImmA (M78 family)/transcriptional regulator with XRE-family HTH domain
VSLDAREASALFEPAKLRLARQLSAWSRAELARRAGISAAAISQFESGASRPKPATLAQLALVLGLPARFFATARRAALIPSVDDSFFRSLRRTTLRDRERAAAHASLLAELVRAIESRVVLPRFEAIPEIVLDATDPVEMAEEAAEVVRRSWAIPAGPLEHVVRLLERHGIVVCRVPLLTRDVDAFSWAAGPRPLVLLGADKGVYERSRLDAAHELGHMLMHAHDPEPAQPALERQAQRFAGALLLPAAELRAEWPGPRLDWSELLTLKVRWGLSMAAVIYRAREIGLLSHTAHANAMKYLSRKGWRVREPGTRLSPEEPILLNEALELLGSHGVTLEALAETAHLPPSTDIARRLRIEPSGRLSVAL